MGIPRTITMPPGHAENAKRALHVVVRGAVQGVGFRPFVYRLAHEFGLAGYVINTPGGVELEVEGQEDKLHTFLSKLHSSKPSLSVIDTMETAWAPPTGVRAFRILPSRQVGDPGTMVLPDIAVCADCLAEMRDPSDRRYRYPFINCTHCGPRFSIIEKLPYDRPHTSMKAFQMCPQCREEYENPLDRRFHAQPVCCPECGPHLELWGPDGCAGPQGDEALLAIAASIRRGGIAAVKGLGGFHLIVDARNEDAVRRLRERKHRDEKPFALMYPDLEAIRQDCHVCSEEAELLTSPQSPIVLLNRKERVGVSASVAPKVVPLGVMLPYTPLHHLLLLELGFPVVATSGNRSDEPICTDEREALDSLGDIADAFLVHNRPIVRYVDDSIVRLMAGRPAVLRRARGYAPMPVANHRSQCEVLATGGHLKNTVGVSKAGKVFLSQHIGDLDTPAAQDGFVRTAASLQNLYRAQPSIVVRDLHPDYASSRYAESLGMPVTSIQHHYAHVLACMAEHNLDGPVLGVSWDGTGYGDDGTIWGGEFLVADTEGYRRAASLRPFRLPGAAKAVREPRRSAAGILTETYPELGADILSLPPFEDFSPTERQVILRMVASEKLSAVTTSAGRLFDAIASILGIRHQCSFEGQAAMELEALAQAYQSSQQLKPQQSKTSSVSPLLPASNRAYLAHLECGSLLPLATQQYGCTPEFSHRAKTSGLNSLPTAPERASLECGSLLPHETLDWRPLIRWIVDAIQRGVAIEAIAGGVHEALAEGVAAVARASGENIIVLTGGCFQNRLLLERCVQILEGYRFQVYWHQRVPANDGGIALGQAHYALSQTTVT